jgi:hypothetical protein
MTPIAAWQVPRDSFVWPGRTAVNQLGLVQAIELHLFPDFVCTVDLFVGLSDALDVSNQRLVTLGTRAAQLGIALMGGMAPIA